MAYSVGSGKGGGAKKVKQKITNTQAALGTPF
jgi:hypothetical protein